MANTPGDFTGIQKKKLSEKHRKEQEERASEMAMVTATAEASKSREVVDYTKAKAEPKTPDGPVDYTETDEDPTIDEIVAATREDDEPAAQSPQPVAVAPTTVQKGSRLIRARYDLEQVTIGHGTSYDFEAGRQYRVDPNVAEHLAERDLVDVLQ